MLKKQLNIQKSTNTKTNSVSSFNSESSILLMNFLTGELSSSLSLGKPKEDSE
jgi:hypothetical protein